MAQSDKKEQIPGEGAAESPGKFIKILKIVFIVFNLGTLGVGAWLVFETTIGFEPPKLTEEDAVKDMEKERAHREEQPVIYTMDKFTVNLDGIPRRVIQTELSLEMLDEEGFEEVVSLGAEARDAVVKLFNSKTYTDIETIQGKLFLKDQIAKTLNQFLKKGVVKDVYFGQFVVQ